MDPEFEKEEGSKNMIDETETETKKDRTFLDLLNLMEEFHPMIPDAITDFYLMKSGVECEDIRLKRLLALAAQKFISDVANDALHHSRLRQSGQKDKRGGKEKKLTLTMEDLSSALNEYGIHVKRPVYYT